MDGGQHPDVAVLIACHNRRAKTLACLASLAEQQVAARLHLIVFDDSSTDGTAEAIRDAYPDIELLAGSGAAFWASGMRAAFSHALRRDDPFYLWLNDDVRLRPDAVARLLEAHARLSREGQAFSIIGGAVGDPAGSEVAYGGIRRRAGLNPLRFERMRRATADLATCDTLNGNVVLIPRVTARAIGSIGTPFIQTLGDLDYGLRVKRAGGWVGVVPGVVGWCAPNRVEARWLNPDLPLRARWRIVSSPLGMPFRPWLHFARAHGGPCWFVFVLAIYWRLFVPIWVIRVGRRWRGRRDRSRRRHVPVS